MQVFTIYKTQKLPIPLPEIWEFFSDPHNLKDITPVDLGLQIKTAPKEKMYNGMIITYRVTLIANFSMTWVTEIKNIHQPHSFIDEQRFGPYRFWHHRHTFRDVPGGVEIGDLIHYALPFGIFSPMINDAIIAPKLEKIFTHRAQTLAYKFGTLA